MYRVFSICVVLLLLTYSAAAQTSAIKTRVAVLDFGSSKLGKQFAGQLRNLLRSNVDIQVSDPDLTTAAANGVGYNGSLNLSLTEARDLGSAIGSDFYLLGDAQTLRRTSSNAPLYYESYLTLFLISARTGRLIFWDRLNAKSNDESDAETTLFKILSESGAKERWLSSLWKAKTDESNERLAELDLAAPILEEAPGEDESTPEMGLSLPKPYRRLKPAYPDVAAHADVEATVDVLVDIDADGEVKQVRVARWAGFGLDETTVATVRQLHFFPAKRDGNAIPMRVLLRYNFRKPAP